MPKSNSRDLLRLSQSRGCVQSTSGRKTGLGPITGNKSHITVIVRSRVFKYDSNSRRGNLASDRGFAPQTTAPNRSQVQHFLYSSFVLKIKSLSAIIASGIDVWQLFLAQTRIQSTLKDIFLYFKLSNSMYDSYSGNLIEI